MRQVVLEEIKNSLPKMMADVFNHAAKVFKFSAVDATEDTDDGSYAELKDSLMAMFVEAMLNKYASTTKIKEPERYVKIKDRLKKDFSQVILRYINSVEFNDSDKSDLLKIFG